MVKHPALTAPATPPQLMKRIARLIGLFSILLCFFIAALLASQQLLHRQTERLRDEAIAQRRAQLAAALELAGLGEPPWPEDTHRALEQALDARIRLAPASEVDARGADGAWQFVSEFGAHAASTRAVVSFAPPPAARLLTTYQRVAAILFNLALGVIAVFAAFLLWSVRNREAADDATALDRDSAQAGLRSLHQLASVSARQSAELERERTDRLRAEEDLHIKQLLLNRALEQKIRLGQDLHDGIIQSLYATGLTLEATRSLLPQDPGAADARIADATQTLNRTIRDVRSYINGLSPDALRRQTFTQAVQVLTRELAAGRAIAFDVAIDDTAAGNLPGDVATDLLQIVREAVSNSLRHGGASRVGIRLQASDHGTVLAVEDNGAGFAPATRSRSGHGLSNMAARAERHGGGIAVEERPGSGTIVTCRLPTFTTAPA